MLHLFAFVEMMTTTTFYEFIILSIYLMEIAAMNMGTITSLAMLISVVRDLADKEITARPEQTFKEITADNDTDPHALFEVLHGLVVQ